MGKKRRLIKKSNKFSSKFSSHPVIRRMPIEDQIEKVEIKEEKLEIKKEKSFSAINFD